LTFKKKDKIANLLSKTPKGKKNKRDQKQRQKNIHSGDVKALDLDKLKYKFFNNQISTEKWEKIVSKVVPKMESLISANCVIASLGQRRVVTCPGDQANCVFEALLSISNNDPKNPIADVRRTLLSSFEQFKNYSDNGVDEDQVTELCQALNIVVLPLKMVVAIHNGENSESFPATSFLVSDVNDRGEGHFGFVTPNGAKLLKYPVSYGQLNSWFLRKDGGAPQVTLKDLLYKPHSNFYVKATVTKSIKDHNRDVTKAKQDHTNRLLRKFLDQGNYAGFKEGSDPVELSEM
jgi:hypothetical protein